MIPFPLEWKGSQILGLGFVHAAMDWDQNSSMPVWRCHQLLFGFVTKHYFPGVSRLSVNDKDANEVKSRAVHSSGIYLTVKGSPRKSQLGDNLMRLVASHFLKWDPLPSNEVDSKCLDWKFLSMSHGLRPESSMLVFRCHQILFGFLAKDQLLRVSLLSINDKDDEMKPRAVYRIGLRLK